MDSKQYVREKCRECDNRQQKQPEQTQLDLSVLHIFRYLFLDGNIDILAAIASISIFQDETLDTCCYRLNEKNIMHRFILDNDEHESIYTIEEMKELLREYFSVMEKTNSLSIYTKDISILNILYLYFEKQKKIDALRIELIEMQSGFKGYQVIVDEQVHEIKKELSVLEERILSNAR